jgi:hypothetical protein
VVREMVFFFTEEAVTAHDDELFDHVDCNAKLPVEREIF